MSALPQDDELSALLGDLDDVGEAASPVKLAGKPIKQPKKASEPEPEPEPDPEPDMQVPEHVTDTVPEQNGEVDLSNLYSSSLSELLANYRKDRQDIDKLIAFLWDRLNKSDPSRVLFETLAVSLRTKSEANSNLVKLLDNISKKLDKSTGVEGLDLEGLLDD